MLRPRRRGASLRFGTWLQQLVVGMGWSAIGGQMPDWLIEVLSEH
jgi:hypothetical protein